MSAAISVCFPAFNEEPNIAITIADCVRVLKRLKKPYEILVVDDGSTDNTRGIVTRISSKNSKIRLIQHGKNKGYAAATQSCLSHASGDTVFVIDSDRQHSMEDIPRFLEKINEGYDIVVGWKKKRNDPFMRVLMSRTYNLMFRILFNSKLHDVDCGFRCFTKNTTQKIKIEMYGVPVGPELFAKALAQKMLIAEIPVRHFPRQAGKSVFRPFHMPMVITRIILNLLRLKRRLSYD